MSSNCDFDKGRNKVYINPNFNRSSVNNHYPMHVNPRFSHLLQGTQPNVIGNQTRIHINPNFVKSKNVGEVVKVNNASTICFQPKTVSNESNLLCSYEKVTIENPKLTVSVPVSKSRYCLVRQNTNTLFEEPVLDKPKTTFQLNKYKSIPLKDIKRNLDSTKTSLNRQTTVTAPQAQLLQKPPVNRKWSSANSTKRSQFKLVNNNKSQMINAKNKTRTVIDLHKKTLSNQPRLHKSKGNLKKNNIPCPMFRKFGKCLRKERGNCVFLHDKKHVSICRKFIKGLCHDKDCLLSHDLTTKKMPTCYFYLQGTCTKADCPYLHVKLNEKTKVCSDFLKGYCERGSKCLQRHANVQTVKKVKDSFVSRSLSTCTQKKYCKLNAKKMDNPISSTTLLVQSSTRNQPLTDKNENNMDRYYQANKGDVSVVETCETIKPTRCKLGTLPSFIQL